MWLWTLCKLLFPKVSSEEHSTGFTWDVVRMQNPGPTPDPPNRNLRFKIPRWLTDTLNFGQHTVSLSGPQLVKCEHSSARKSSWQCSVEFFLYARSPCDNSNLEISGTTGSRWGTGFIGSWTGTVPTAKNKFFFWINTSPPSALICICKFIFIFWTAEPLLGFDCVVRFDINFNMQQFEFKVLFRWRFFPSYGAYLYLTIKAIHAYYSQVEK